MQNRIVITTLQTILNDRIHGDAYASSNLYIITRTKQIVNIYCRYSKPEHKTVYSNNDNAMLDENRTLAPAGCLREP